MKNIDYKLINIALISFICFLLIKSAELWLLVIDKLYSILFPIFIGFVIAYFLYPILNKLNEKIPKVLSIGILIFIILFLVAIIVILIIPPLYDQIINLIGYILVFTKDISLNYNIDLSNIESNLIKIFNEIIINLGKFVSNGAIKTINTSINVITNIIVSISCSIYFLIDMDKIRKYIKKLLIKNKNLYDYFKMLDEQINNYFKGLSKLILISFFEYTTIYYIIGNPNAILLGFLSAFSNLVPCFGGIIVQIVSFITSVAIDIRLGITVLIINFILSIFDSYILNPFVYGKSNKIHPLIVILSVFTGSLLLGFVGVLIALPISIIIVNTIIFITNKLKKNS